MLYLAESRVVVLVGIPGVGKTSLVTKIVEIIKDHEKTVTVMSFGTLMYDVAKDNGLDDRDALRKLPLSKQQELQKIVLPGICLEFLHSRRSQHMYRYAVHNRVPDRNPPPSGGFPRGTEKPNARSKHTNPARTETRKRLATARNAGPTPHSKTECRAQPSA